MKRTIAGLAVGLVLGGAVSAQAISGVPWRSESPYVAVVRCNNMAEDSMGHLRLIDFERKADGTLRLVYACKRYGY
jgi:hypothetical protein